MSVSAPVEPLGQYASFPLEARRRAKLILVLAFLLLLGVSVCFQFIQRAYGSEFGGYPDESAHYVTGLLIHDYIASGFPTKPIPYAEKYYVHYPKVGFGMWGPLLHITEALWMFVLSPARWSMLLLMAVITTLTALTLYREIAADFSQLAALCTAIAFLCMPDVRLYTGMIMADGLVALTAFQAAIFFGKYMEKPQLKYSVYFGLWTCLSIFTKGNGVALILLPPIALLLGRRLSLLKSPAFWAAPVIILVFAGPWQYFSLHMLSGILIRQPGWTFAGFYTRHILALFGVALLPFIIAGVVARVVVPFRRNAVEGKWAATAALVAAVWAFNCLVPSGGTESRYLITVVPPMLMFVAAGIAWIAKEVTFGGMAQRKKVILLSALAVVLFIIPYPTIAKKQYYGFSEVASDLVTRPDLNSPVILVSTNSDEGMLISELAMRDKRPGRFVLRATKVLSVSDWNSDRYKLLYDTPQKLMAYLESIPVGLVVISTVAGRPVRAHHEEIQRTLRMYADKWVEVGRYPHNHPSNAADSTILVYRLKSASSRPPGKISIDLPYTLGRSVEN